MSDYEIIEWPRGSSRPLVGTITNPADGSPIDLRLNGTTLTMTAWLDGDDPDDADNLLWTKSYERAQDGTITEDGITVPLTDPGSEYRIDMDAVDTSALAAGRLVAYRLLLVEPDTESARPIRGHLTIAG